jgi:hypothetical protein
MFRSCYKPCFILILDEGILLRVKEMLLYAVNIRDVQHAKLFENKKCLSLYEMLVKAQTSKNITIGAYFMRKSLVHTCL